MQKIAQKIDQLNFGMKMSRLFNNYKKCNIFLILKWFEITQTQILLDYFLIS